MVLSDVCSFHLFGAEREEQGTALVTCCLQLAGLACEPAVSQAEQVLALKLLSNMFASHGASIMLRMFSEVCAALATAEPTQIFQPALTPLATILLK